ncbi:conserved domain protein [Myxococcus xanthus DK 1622]|uniref:Conserved domain protein n=3 Tax=Myxococcaceae TaxID=31 RepID=Q1D821_MYXXD|nr:conserved domain protein [Myxococcus xanthus DK 1622]
MPMEDLKSVTVSYLRELARKHLGSGYSRMKKEELLAALAAYVPALAKLARLAGIRVLPKRSATKPAASPARAPAARKAKTPATDAAKAPRKSKSPTAAKPKTDGAQDQGRVSAPKRVAAKRASEKPGSKPTVKPAKVVTFPPKPRVERAREPVTPVMPSVTRPLVPAPEPVPRPVTRPAPVQKPAEPVEEGFFVARVAGEEEARSHHLVESAPVPPPPPVDAEGLGALPERYQDDAVLLLPRDPHTLFVSWDFSLGALLRAQDALEAPRTVLRVFGDEQMERELDFTVEARGFYIQGLPSGRTYRVEAHFVGRDGRSCRIGASSNRVTLPPAGVSTDLTVRFLRVPPLEAALPAAVVEAPPEEEREYVSWRRVNLPGSGGVLDVPEVHRERRGRDMTEAHLEGPARAPGASDQQYVESVERVPGASDQRYADSVGRAAGASDQRYLSVAALRNAREVRGPVTAPVSHYLETLGRAPGASDMRHAEGDAHEAGRGPGPRAYLDVKGVPGASDLRYAEGGAARQAGRDTSPHRYLDMKGIPGASDLRYAEGGATRLPVSGASPYRYLDVQGIPGASDLRYAEGAATSQPHHLDVSRIPGASDLRYLESPPRAPGASEQRYLESSPQRAGASERRYLDAPERVSGVSERRHLDSPPQGTGASGRGFLGAPAQPSGAADTSARTETGTTAKDAHGAGTHPPAVEENHRYFEAPPRSSGATVPSSDAQAQGDADAEEDHRYFEVRRSRAEGAAHRRTATPSSFEAREDHATHDAAEPPPRKPPSDDGRS